MLKKGSLDYSHVLHSKKKSILNSWWNYCSNRSFSLDNPVINFTLRGEKITVGWSNFAQIDHKKKMW